MKVEEDFEMADREPESKETPRDYLGCLALLCCLPMIPLAFVLWGILGALGVVVASCLAWCGYRHIRNSEAVTEAVVAVLVYLFMVGVLVFVHGCAFALLSPMFGPASAAAMCLVSFVFAVASFTGFSISSFRRGRRLVKIDGRYVDPLEE